MAIPSTGKTFKCCLIASLPRLKELFENENLWKDKIMTVKHMGWTNDGKPRINKGKGIRDYE